MNKAAIRDRAGGRCEYCRDPEWLSLAAFHTEHIISRKCGGGDDDANVALACPDCNLAKGPNIAALDLESGELTRIFHPRRDSWAEHFQISGTSVHGRTPVGRTTVRLLDLNTAPRLKHRALLQALGEWEVKA